MDKLGPTLCGGWINYALARVLLYPTDRSTQFDVRLDNGTRIPRSVGDRLLTILERHEIKRDWQAGDLLLVDNKRMMHGKIPHRGPREIVVAMA